MAAGRATRATLRVQLAPLGIALGYALARTIQFADEWTLLHYPSPFTLSFLAGLLMAYACRPVLSRLSWTRNMCALVALALLLGLGTAAARAATWVGLHLGGAVPPLAGGQLWPELLAAVLAALLMGVLYAPRDGRIDWADLVARLRSVGGAYWKRVGAWAVFAVVLQLALGWVDARLWRGNDPALAPLFADNPWSRLTGSGDVLTAGGLLLLWWVRALALILPIVPIALVLRGSLIQLVAVFALLYFVLGDFAPLMTDQPYFSAAWLVARVSVGALGALLLGLAAAVAIGQIRRPG